jgi:hypothetical protein
VLIYQCANENFRYLKFITKKIFMKKNLLLMMMCCPMMLAAQNGVTVSGLAISAGTVTFTVSWDRDAMPVALWSDTVWVFVDYNDAGVMKRLPVTDATVSAGTVTKVPNNDKGVWVVGDAREHTSFSATVQLLTTTADLAGACAYASNYPPVGEYKNNATEISFTGTPEYKVVLERSDKSTYTATVGKDESLLIPSGEVVLSFTDKTGAPGLLSCIPSSAYTLSGAGVCEGADVTLTLSGSESGWHYQLYKDNIPVGSENEGTGNALTFSEASTDVGSFSYTVRTVDATGAQCEMQVSNVHAIMVKPVPTITRSGGDASQTVYQHMAIDTIVYTASDVATISLTDGGFPADVGGTATGSSFTISGMPSATGTFGYSLTAAVDGCISPPSVGAITVNIITPPQYAASAKTWTVGNQMWSDVINIPECDHDAYTNSGTVPYCRSYTVNGRKWYYYNRAYVDANLDTLCPSPWRLPTAEDFLALDILLGGPGELHYPTQAWIDATYVGIWGGVRGAGRAGGYYAENVIGQQGSVDFWWSDTLGRPGYRYILFISVNEGCLVRLIEPESGLRVRCVR